MNSPSKVRLWLRRVFVFATAVIAVLVVALLLWAAYCLRDRNRGYQVALDLDGQAAKAAPRPLQAGFGRVKINPDLSDPKRPVWLAGFSNGRAATAQHDDLWAVAGVLDDGCTRFGIVVLDAIGFFHDDVIAVRRQLPDQWKLSYTIVCTTHNHSTPDLMGIWGPSLLKTGVDGRYRESVIASAAKALGEAVAALRPARLSLHQIPLSPAGLVADTRKPEVFDSDLRLMLFADPASGQTIGSIVSWGNHPETPWSRNTEITADFPGYLRLALEQGIVAGGTLRQPGLGGIHLYVNGAIGGLMTTHPSITVHDPFLNQDFGPPSHEKARAVGHVLAQRILAHLSATNVPAADTAPITIRARTLALRVDNVNFLLAPLLGLIDRGQVRWKHIRSEVALVTVGDASIACVPGELYPELANGGMVRAPGGDYDLEPVEAPPLREMMPGRLKFIFGLANDEVGYIIPKSEWDQRPPWLFGASKPVYGEVNSMGPDTAPELHRAIRELCR